jgi:hypothetical protein
MPHCRYLSKMKPLAHFIRQADPAFSCRVYLQLLKRMIEADDPTRFVHQPPALVLAALVGIEAEAALLGDVATFRDKKSTGGALATHRASRAILERDEITFYWPLSQLLPTVEQMEEALRLTETDDADLEWFEGLLADVELDGGGRRGGRRKRRKREGPRWRVLNHGGSQGHDWKEWGFAFEEEEAHALYERTCKGRKVGGVKLLDPAGAVIAEMWLGYRGAGRAA